MHTPARGSKISALSQPPTSLLVSKQTLDVSPKALWRHPKKKLKVFYEQLFSPSLSCSCLRLQRSQSTLLECVAGWHGREWNGMPKRDDDGDGIRMDAWTDADGRMEVPSLSLSFSLFLPDELELFVPSRCACL